MYKKKKRITHLSLGEVQRRGDFDPPWPAQILAEMKLLFELQQLRVGVRGPQSPWQTVF